MSVPTGSTRVAWLSPLAARQDPTVAHPAGPSGLMSGSRPDG
ncbi:MULTISPECIES: hypothetical protein [unclassified Micromonospora]|nr:hypothetical protein [Micromonospora sp. AKA38]